jgi:hypothetical protein
MPYTHTAPDGRTSYLHGKIVAGPDARRQAVYWFARQLEPETVLDALPPGYRIAESPVTRRPYLRKS